eukprot:2976443-Pyramimonas_sp.AAC.1
MEHIMSRRFTSLLFKLPGMKLHYVVADFMRACCLGVLQCLLGNVVWELCVSLGGTASPDTVGCKHALA